MNNPELVYINGVMVPWDNATIHVSSVAAKYGANVFEGLCAYAGAAGPLLFRVEEHLVRLERSLRMMQIDADWSDEDYLDAILLSLEANRIRRDAQIRLTVFVTGDGFSDGRGPSSLVCVVRPRTAMRLDERAAHATVSTWRRLDDQIAPSRIKAGAYCHHSRFGQLEARRNGYDEAIFLTLAGTVSEGASSAFALVRDGVIITPSTTASILESVTRATLVELARHELGLRVEEREIDRSELYVADEAFLCGSDAEIRPVLSIDRFPVGNGRVGLITRRLWDAYDAVVRGRQPARAAWLTPVRAAAANTAPAAISAHA
jgi:branched-chain amino acid aminotransferase